MIGRRRFLSLLGVGAAATPLAAKQVADEAITAVTSLRGYDAAALAPGIPVAGSYGAPAGPEDAAKINTKMSDYLRLFGKLPDHIEKNLRADSKHVTALDPDIAAKRSWSMSVKIQEQRQRNYQRHVDRYRNMGDFERAKKAFRDLTGFDWGW